MATGNLGKIRGELREILRGFSKESGKAESADQAMKDEAKYAATGLDSEVVSDRLKAVEFLEILSNNSYAQEFLLKALNDKESSVAMKSLHAIGKVAGPGLIPRLKEYSDKCKSKQVLQEVTKVINKLEKKAI